MGDPHHHPCRDRPGILSTTAATDSRPVSYRDERLAIERQRTATLGIRNHDDQCREDLKPGNRSITDYAQHWKATVTGFDAEYKVKGTHPMGGVLSLLWHEQVGPLFAATMNAYSLIEAPNMQSCYDPDLMPGSPRVELIREGVRYSNLDDRDARIT